MADFITFDPRAKRDNRRKRGRSGKEEGDSSTKRLAVDANQRMTLKKKEKEKRALIAHWYQCGCESEGPQKEDYLRDRRRAQQQRRQQLLPLAQNEGNFEQHMMAFDNAGAGRSQINDDAEDEYEDAPFPASSFPRSSTERNITMTSEDWDDINSFARQTGLRLLFDVNVLKRTRLNEWNSSNADLLLRYNAERNFSLDYQLGNEPNHFPYRVHRTVTAKQLAKDFHAFRSLLQSGNVELVRGINQSINQMNESIK